MESVINFLFQEKVIAPILIFIVSILLSKVAKKIVLKLISKGKEGFERKRRTTITELIHNVIKVFIYVIAVIMILNVYGIDTSGILASLGIAGVVLGFALQSTVEDFMSGIIIILDNYYMIGDIIRIGEFEGEVMDLTLKSTKLKTGTGETYIFANRNMNAVVNLSQRDYGILLKIPTAYECEVKKVEAVLKKVVEKAKTMEGVKKESEYLGLDKFDASSINYAIIIYCGAPYRFKVRRAVLRLIKDAYDQENIKIPYDQIEVHYEK
ncbi:MAG: mechanosensitive ion channel family protein [Bacilli bacterium]|nr:mechanosensitive ion channel family protein [Bacilli bacterium]